MPILTNDHGWVLETQTTGYAFGLNEAGLLAHRYWGTRLPEIDDYPQTPNPSGWPRLTIRRSERRKNIQAMRT